MNQNSHRTRRAFSRGLNFILAASISALSATSASAGGVPAREAKIFPTPKCVVSEAVPNLEYSLSEIGVPTWDGDLPWPLMIGYWSNLERDLYMTVSMEDIPQSQFGRVVVTFRSICGHVQKGQNNYLAYGAKIVTPADFKKKELQINLRNLGLNGESLVAILEIVKDEKHNEESQRCEYDNANLKVTVKEKTDRLAKPFVAERMLQFMHD